MPPTLVYHGTPRMYPDAGGGSGSKVAAPTALTGLGIDTLPAIVTPDDNGEPQQELSIAAIRFAQPVRLSSLRVIPSGVVHRDGIGETDPTEFMAEVFLNVAPSDPVNALVRTQARVWPAPHALDFAIDMPPGTSTRLVIFRAPAKKITLSLYAHEAAETGQAVEASRTSCPARSPPTKLPLPSAKELIAALPSLPDSEAKVRSQVLASLTAVARETFLLEDLLKSDSVLALAEMTEAGRALRSILAVDDETFDARSALLAIFRLDHPLQATYPSPMSALAQVIQLGEAQKLSRHPQAGPALSATVRLLAPVLSAMGKDQEENTSRLVTEHLVRTLATFAVHATARGTATPIPVPVSRARTVLSTLLPLSAEVTIDGFSCAQATQKLAQPFLSTLSEDDTLRRAYLPASTTLSPVAAPSSPAVGTPRTPPLASQAQASNLLRAINAQGESSLAVNPTPTEILAVVAPHLLVSLSTAPAPPLGIPSALPSRTSGSASDYAGKVYSAHEFRRERDTVSGLGIGLAGVGRKASRHVDEFR